MKIYDSVKKEEVEIADYKDLIKIMRTADRWICT